MKFSPLFPRVYKLDLSIIIVNWNTGSLLRECIASLYSTIKAHTFEVIVVDNASTDKSAHDTSNWPRLHVIYNGQNVGFAAANNQGFRRSTGKYLLILNPDTIALPGAIDRLVDFLELHPHVGAVGPRLLSSTGDLQPSCSHYPSLFNVSMEALGLSRLFPRKKLFARTTMTYWDHDFERQVEVVCGACLMLRRDALWEVGFLDERFYIYYEETDICLRLSQAGLQSYLVPSAEIIHLGGQSSLKNLDVRIIARYRSLLVFYDKHYPCWQSLVLRGMLIFEISWHIAFLFLMGIPSLRTKRNDEILSRYLQVIRMCFNPVNNLKMGLKAAKPDGQGRQ